MSNGVKGWTVYSVKGWTVYSVNGWTVYLVNGWRKPDTQAAKGNRQGHERWFSLLCIFYTRH